MDKIAILIPCYNEAQTIGKVVADFRAALPEATVYVYDNNSADDTAAIQAATGVNLLEELMFTALGKETGRVRAEGSSVYRHVVMKDGVLRACGEKEFGHVREPRMVSGLFGADDVITDYEPGKSEWRATLITHGPTEEEVDRRCASSIERILDECSVETFIDGSPEVI